MIDDRRLTFIVVPHGDLETRTFELSYRRLKLLLVAGVVVLVVFVIMVSSWWYVAAQAARVAGLEREVSRLEADRAKVAELAKTLEQVEAQYERVRQLLGTEPAAKSKEPIMPPLVPRKGPAAGASAPGSTSPQ
jgi:hypothetical protein